MGDAALDFLFLCCPCNLKDWADICAHLKDRQRQALCSQYSGGQAWPVLDAQEGLAKPGHFHMIMHAMTFLAETRRKFTTSIQPAKAYEDESDNLDAIEERSSAGSAKKLTSLTPPMYLTSLRMWARNCRKIANGIAVCRSKIWLVF